MWQEKKAFDYRSLTVQSLDSPLKTTVDHIAAFQYFGMHVAVSTKDGVAFEGSVEDGTATERPVEVFVCGCSNGLVFATSLNDVKLQCRSPLTVPPSTSVQIHRHSEEEGLIALTLHEGIIASCGEKSIKVSYFLPVCGEEIVTLDFSAAPQTLTPRSLLLWEGHRNWSQLEEECTALYLFSGHDDGVVRLWRIDVVEKTYEPFQCFCFHYPEQDEQARVHRQLRVPVYSLALDADTKNAGEPVRLIAGSSNRWAAWELSVAPQGSRSTAILPHPPARHAPEHIHSSRALNLFVWLRGKRFIQEQLFGAAGGEFSQHVKWKPKYNSVLDSLEIGTIVNEQPTTSSSTSAVRLFSVTFPDLKATLTVPEHFLSEAVLPSLLANAHQGNVFCLRVLRKGRFASGGADGVVKVWDWKDADAKYYPTFKIKAHSDLVKSLHVLREPDILLSCGYDGLMKEWHLIDAPEEVFFCRTMLACVVRDGGTGAPSGGSGALLGIGSSDVMPALGVLFTCGVFEAVIRSYKLIAVDTCELPPGWCFDGYRSVKLHADSLAWVDEPAEGRFEEVDADLGNPSTSKTGPPPATSPST